MGVRKTLIFMNFNELIYFAVSACKYHLKLAWHATHLIPNYLIKLVSNQIEAYMYRKISNRIARLLDSGLGLFYFSHECSLIAKL